MWFLHDLMDNKCHVIMVWSVLSLHIWKALSIICQVSIQASMSLCLNFLFCFKVYLSTPAAILSFENLIYSMFNINKGEFLHTSKKRVVIISLTLSFNLYNPLCKESPNWEIIFLFSTFLIHLLSLCATLLVLFISRSIPLPIDFLFKHTDLNVK